MLATMVHKQESVLINDVQLPEGNQNKENGGPLVINNLQFPEGNGNKEKAGPPAIDNLVPCGNRNNNEGLLACNSQNRDNGGALTRDGRMRAGNEYMLEMGCHSGYKGSPTDEQITSYNKEQNDVKRREKKKRCCPRGPGFWCKKYFWEGQELKKPMTVEQKKVIEMLPLGKRILIKYRRIIAFGIPALFCHFFWWAVMIQFNLWDIFPDKYPMTITMIAGSIIAGMTSEGGGAVAFPVMTLVLNVDPSIARDFSMMIQSFGMSCATFTIFFMRVRIEWHALILCSLGGLGGIIFGLHVVDPALTPPVKKLGFVSIWFAFASVLIFLNRTAKRRTFKTIPEFNIWKAFVLLICGFIGGIFTSFSGSGLDICSFMILTLLFRVSEKVATPTSVILMASNSLIGFYWRGVMLQAITQDAWEYLLASLPIVVFGAPIGSVLGSHFHRLVLAGLVILLDMVALVTAFAIIRPLTPTLIGGCVAVIVGCFAIFMGITWAGQKMLDKYEARHMKATAKHRRDSTMKNSPTSNGMQNNKAISANGKMGNGHINQAFQEEVYESEENYTHL